MRPTGITAGLLAAGLLAGMSGEQAVGAEYPPPVEGDFLIRDLKFASGEALPELRIHYRTVGRAHAPEESRHHAVARHGKPHSRR